MLWILAVVVAIGLITRYHLRGEELSRFDAQTGESFNRGQPQNDEHRAVIETLASGLGSIQQAPRRQRLQLMREYMDGMSANQDYVADITPVDAGGVPAEWVLAPGANTARRALYIHGGAFVMGSPKSHRNITSCFSAAANAAVLAIDYRLLPENRRRDGVADCRNAYRWLLQNGPEGVGAAERIFVGGDSAGGNLTLSLIAWLRQQTLRKPDAAVALSPLTDSTFSSPSLRSNLHSDAMLGPMFKRMERVPGPLLWWASWLQNRISPSNPLVSPVFGDLAGLPPTLVHASEAEVLFDDARRYVNRAVAAGSPVQLQSWGQVVHVWHMFYPQLTEAREAWEQVKTFIAQIDASLEAQEGAK